MAGDIQIDLGGLKWPLELLEKWIESDSTERAHARGLFLTALRLTQRYIRNVEKNPDYRNVDDEDELSEAWQMAAEAVQPLSHELYRRCLSKCLHWSGCIIPEGSVLRELDTSIDTMIEIASRLD